MRRPLGGSAALALAALVISIVLAAGAAARQGEATGAVVGAVGAVGEVEEDAWVVLETEHGRVVIDLLQEVAPQHVENFQKLVRQGYYVGRPFHRVIEGFMAQGGGDWDEEGRIVDVGYTLPAEIDARMRHVRGSVAAARRGDQVNPTRRSSGSQFYICLAPASWLDGQYTIFGHVVEGMDVVDRITLGRGASGEVDPEAATRIERAWLTSAAEHRGQASDHDSQDTSE